MAFFITVEGGDGAGKSTLLGRVESLFRRRNIPFLSTREPGGTTIADEIREILLKPGRKLVPMAELFLFEAARAEHVETAIRPALSQGKHVLCDRFTHSTLAFQGYARGLGARMVEELNLKATAGLKPDAVIWLKISPKDAQRRIEARGELSRIDAEKTTFHESVFKAFEQMARDEPERFIVLDASQPAETVFNELLSHAHWRRLFGSEVHGP